MPEENPHVVGGPLLTELSNAMVALHRAQFGRGPAAAKSLIFDDIVICTLTDVYTQVEKTLVGAGKHDHVRETRAVHQYALEKDYKRPVEQLTGRRVEAFISAVNFDPDLGVEIFILEPEG